MDNVGSQRKSKGIERYGTEISRALNYNLSATKIAKNFEILRDYYFPMGIAIFSLFLIFKSIYFHGGKSPLHKSVVENPVDPFPDKGRRGGSLRTGGITYQ